MQPNMVWLLLVPFLNIYWNFVFVRKMTDSFNNEFFDRKIAVEEQPTQRNGYFFAGSFLVFNFPLPMFVNFVCLFLSLIALVIYNAKIREHKRLLQQNPESLNEI